ncbi:MAG: hypothetical protein WCP69_13820 [Bacteroidota bacterium]
MKFNSIFNSLLVMILIFFSLDTINAQDLAQIKNEKPFTINGSLGASGLFYGVNGIEARSKPFSYLFSGNLNMSIYGIQIPLSFVYSEQERDFRQPFNQFGLSPKYKWVTVHLGYRNVDYSSFAFSGQTILGAGVDLKPGLFRFGFMYGRFNRAVGMEQSGTANSTPSFERKGWTTRIGYGTQQNFADLVLVRAQDDNNSISFDSTANSPKAAANMVVGLNSKLKFSKFLSFESEGALSIYTENINSDVLEGSNSFLVDKSKGFIPVNSSTSSKTALRALLNYKKKLYGARLVYRRIDPSYKSMGTYFMNDDCQQITIEPSVNLFKQKLVLRLSSGIQNDNLENTKKTTTHRFINSLFASYNPNSRFAIDGSYANYQYNQQAGRVPLVDSTKTYQTNENITLSPRLIFAGTKKSQIINFTYNFMRLIDNNKFTENFNEYSVHNLLAGYVISWNELNMSVSSGVNYTSMTNQLGTINLYGLSAGINRNFMKNTLTLALPICLQRNSNNLNSAWILTTSVGVNYKLPKHHSLSLMLNYIGNYSDNTLVSPTFNEIKGALQYIYTF